MVGKANSTLALANGQDMGLLRRAIGLYEEAVPTIRAELPAELPGVERSLAGARAVLNLGSLREQVGHNLAQLEQAAAALKSVEHEEGETLQDRQAHLLVASSLSPDAIVARVSAAIQGVAAAPGHPASVAEAESGHAQLRDQLDKLKSIAQANPEGVREVEQKLAMLGSLREQLCADLQAGMIRPLRRLEIEEVIDEIEAILTTKSDGVLAAQANLGRVVRLTERVMSLKPDALDDRLASLHLALKEDMSRLGQSPHDAKEGQRLFVASARLGPDLQDALAAGNATMHEPRLRSLSVETQRHLRRHNVMIAEPLWDCPKLVPDPHRLFFAGTVEIERELAASCALLGLSLVARRQGGDEGQQRWNQLRSAGAAIFDVRGERGPMLAQIYYELGLAMSLGLPASILSQEGQALPFDVEDPPIFLRRDGNDADRLTGAVQLAYGRPYRCEPNVSMTGTLTAALQYADEDQSPAGHLRVALDTAKQAHAARDATLFTETLRTVIGLLPGRRLQLLHPSHPPSYSQPGTRRLFHVMPFSETWSSGAMHAAELACTRAGAEYVRGDRPDTARVLRSIWTEVGHASHLLVDITGFNVNVAFELGLAHARGKPTLIVVRGTDGKAGVFRPSESSSSSLSGRTRADRDGRALRRMSTSRSQGVLCPSLRSV